jgi:hypothetical protein
MKALCLKVLHISFFWLWLSGTIMVSAGGIGIALTHDIFISSLAISFKF